MKTRKKEWKALKSDKLSEMNMMRLRGGDGDESGEPPAGPIIKGP